MAVCKCIDSERVDFAKIASITFENPDMENFEGLKLAYEAGKMGGSMPTVFNAANELAVAMFLEEKIKFLDIYEIIKYCMSNHKVIQNPSLNDILNIEKQTYDIIKERW